ncbi:MAG: hypothetical protein FJ027_17045 [Candidatus Rokubacteria bacterium]|nr:hypothetical protein [Candidatus Rokubacteria bacterium]
MKDATVKANEIFGQASDKAVETMAMWAEANQRVLRELVELSAGAAKESVRLYAELQQGAMDAVRDSQATALKWHATWQDGPKDPMGWYQQALAEGVEGAQKFFRMVEGGAQAVTRSAERLQTTAEQTGKGIQETVEATVLRVKDAYRTN